MADPDNEKTILVIDDEEAILGLMERFLKSEGFEVMTFLSGEQGLDHLQNHSVDLIMVDLQMPGLSGADFVRTVKEMKYPAEILVISGHGTVETAVETIKLGAFDFIEKPINFEKLLVTINNSLQKSKLQGKIAYLENRIKSYIEFNSIIGESEQMRKTKSLAEQISRTDVNLLISGESGTGKEIFARAIHNAGPRGDGNFVAINCGAIPENLLESEMFGHEKGAFSGAISRRIGHFEHADNGTIFLDEVSELPLSLQVKILRSVQEKEIMRIGNSRPIKVDSRVISATNRDIETEVSEGRFREDLFYRLNVIELKIPPLRERLDDIPMLCEHFIKKHAERPIRLNRDVYNLFGNYNWPGNVRELENVIQRAIALSDEDIITPDTLPEKILLPPKINPDIIPIDNSDFKQAQGKLKDDFEKKYLIDVLQRHKGNVLRSADEMGLTRQTLHRLIKKHGIDSREFKTQG